MSFNKKRRKAYLWGIKRCRCSTASPESFTAKGGLSTFLCHCPPSLNLHPAAPIPPSQGVMVRTDWDPTHFSHRKGGRGRRGGEDFSGRRGQQGPTGRPSAVLEASGDTSDHVKGHRFIVFSHIILYFFPFVKAFFARSARRYALGMTGFGAPST